MRRVLTALPDDRGSNLAWVRHLDDYGRDVGTWRTGIPDDHNTLVKIDPLLPAIVDYKHCWRDQRTGKRECGRITGKWE